MRLIKLNQIIIGSIAFMLLLSFSIINKNATQKSAEKIWINIDYVKCLKKRLPCECEKITGTYYVITLDTNKESKLYGAKGLIYNENEFDQWNIEKKSNGTYKVYNQLVDSVLTIGTLILKENTLCFFDKDNKKSTFRNHNDSKNNESQYFQQNISLLNKSFVKRGYLSLEKTLNQDSLNCSCNKELGGVNLITANGSSKAWIIEQKKDSVFIYDFTNSSAGKSVPHRIDKKLLQRYKW